MYVRVRITIDKEDFQVTITALELILIMVLFYIS